MRIVIYDKNPGSGFGQWFLKTSWVVGCFFQKLFGAVDAYYGAVSWEDALKFVTSLPEPVTSVQYWGHGTPGRVWLCQQSVTAVEWLRLKPKLAPNALLWFRTCSTFAQADGHEFSRQLADGLGCTVAGHTRIIGLTQGGLHTRKPNTPASWSVDEGEFPPNPFPWLLWGNNTITCFATKIPEGW